jgi:hypothetical protein
LRISHGLVVSIFHLIAFVYAANIQNNLLSATEKSRKVVLKKLGKGEEQEAVTLQGASPCINQAGNNSEKF